MLEPGEFVTIAELIKDEEIALPYMSRVMCVTLLTPDIIEAIVDGRWRPAVTLAGVLEPFSVCFAKQQSSLMHCEK